MGMTWLRWWGGGPRFYFQRVLVFVGPQDVGGLFGQRVRLAFGFSFRDMRFVTGIGQWETLLRPGSWSDANVKQRLCADSPPACSHSLGD